MRVLIFTVILSLTLSGRAVAYEWPKITKQGYTYHLAPLASECRSGPLPNYRIVYEPGRKLDKVFPGRQDLGITIYKVELRDGSVYTYDPALVFIRKGLPVEVKADIIQHELAHLRGCEHV